MAKKIIPANILSQALKLSLEQVTAAMEGGGASVVLRSAECIGMMPGGSFVYKCSGEAFRKHYINPLVPNDFSHTLESEGELPGYLAEFKVKLAYERSHVANIKPAFQKEAEKRVLGDDWVLYWG